MILKHGILISIYNKVIGHKRKIRGTNSSVQYSKTIFKKTFTRINGNNNTIKIGDGSKLINSSIIIIGENHTIDIGENCVIKNTVLWIEDENCTIKIGNKTTIEGAHIAVTEPNSTISLGEDCMLSSGIDIRNGDSHSIIDLTTNKRINFAKDIIIGDHVWIGAHAQILKSVKISNNSIIGVRSVVTKDVPENSIATGIPAKIVKENINWDRKRIYN